jgi:putative effector of murein hydrolase LrgA (UPF0299 family)
VRALEGLALLLLCQSAGELAARGLHLPWPGPAVAALAPGLQAVVASLVILVVATWF